VSEGADDGCAKYRGDLVDQEAVQTDGVSKGDSMNGEIDLDIDEIVGELHDLRKRLENMKKAEWELERQVLAFMEAEGATIRKTQNHSVMIEERGVKYDSALLSELITEELVGPLDLEGVYEPAHQKTIDVPASWNMAKGRKLKELGTRQREIVEGARFVGRLAVTIKKWERVDADEWNVSVARHPATGGR
jgi:hypothetical protein